jgi:hypothetical protein
MLGVPVIPDPLIDSELSTMRDAAAGKIEARPKLGGRRRAPHRLVAGVGVLPRIAAAGGERHREGEREIRNQAIGHLRIW